MVLCICGLWEFYTPFLAARQKAMKGFACNFANCTLDHHGISISLEFLYDPQENLSYNAKGCSIRDLRSYVPWKRMGLSSINMTVVFKWFSGLRRWQNPYLMFSSALLVTGLVQRGAEDLWLLWNLWVFRVQRFKFNFWDSILTFWIPHIKKNCVDNIAQIKFNSNVNMQECWVVSGQL